MGCLLAVALVTSLAGQVSPRLRLQRQSLRQFVWALGALGIL
jgi:hypothetical protein